MSLLSAHARFVCMLSALTVALAINSATAESNWPRFRGPEGTGHSQQKDLPVTWSDADIAWKAELGGVGQSSPVIWEDRIFLTSAEKSGAGVERRVLCVSRTNGKILWQKIASTTAGEGLHDLNTWASATCATDGERVVAFFGVGGIHCYDLDGNVLWSRDLGKFAGPWGVAASPVIHGDLVIQNCDADKDAYLVALDKTTGKIVWRTDRFNIRGWSTPIFVKTSQREEMVINGDKGVQAYEAATGKEYWFCKSFIGRGSPVPAVGKGMVFVVNGKPGPMYAVKLGGSGDVTRTHMAWNTPRRGGRDLPSPIVAGGYLFVVNMSGIATCYNPATGKELWKERLGGNFAAAPIAAGGKIYVQNEKGLTFVIKPGDKLDVVARNTVTASGEMFRASLAPCQGQLFLRSNRALYCIGKRAAE